MNPLVKTYNAQLSDYDALREAAIRHLSRLLTEAGLNIHHVTGRVKKPASLLDKLRRKPGRYPHLSDVTDLVGVRVITYFESDVNVVSRLVEQAYEVDWNNSIDKSKMHDPDRFGYMGVHYVVRPEQDSPEFQALKLHDTAYEIQIRSILQHAWAEIEHDLGYKNRDVVPREVRRRFYRLAGLLEMADEEFMAIARMSRDYEATLPQRLEEDPDGVFIDVQSVRYLLEEPPISTLDRRVADALNVTLLSGWPDPERAPRLTRLLQYVGVHSVGLLQKELHRYEEEIVQFSTALMPRIHDLWSPAGGARPGISVVHYGLLRACENPTFHTADIVHMLELNATRSAAQMVRLIHEAYREAVVHPPQHHHTKAAD